MRMCLAVMTVCNSKHIRLLFAGMEEAWRYYLNLLSSFVGSLLVFRPTFQSGLFSRIFSTISTVGQGKTESCSIDSEILLLWLHNGRQCWPFPYKFFSPELHDLKISLFILRTNTHWKFYAITYKVKKILVLGSVNCWTVQSLTGGSHFSLWHFLLS
jgi:hypothetical protein